jgi:hypothetical protein
MGGKSAYLNKELFFPRKPAGKVLLILDGHSLIPLLKQFNLLRKMILSFFVSRAIQLINSSLCTGRFSSRLKPIIMNQ